MERVEELEQWEKHAGIVRIGVQEWSLECILVGEEGEETTRRAGQCVGVGVKKGEVAWDVKEHEERSTDVK